MDFFGYTVGSLLGYYLGEIVLQKTWRIRVNLKGYVAFIAAFIVLALIIKIDPLQYKTKIPDEKMISQIYIGDSPIFFEGDDTSNNASNYLKEKENIEAIRLLHQEIIDKGKKVSIGEWNDGQSVFLMYELKNGKRLAREYHLLNYDSYMPLLAKIYGSNEYKKMVNQVLNVSAQDVSEIKITASGQVDKSITITDRQQLEAAVKALSEDLNNQSFAQMTSSFGDYASIEILLNDNKTIYMNGDSSYPQFSEWMVSTGQSEQALLMADDISYILVAKSDSKIYHTNSESELAQQIEQQPNRLKIKTASEIETAIDNAQIDWSGEYSAAFYYKESRDVDIKSFSGEHVPDFILDHFNEK